MWLDSVRLGLARFGSMRRLVFVGLPGLGSAAEVEVFGVFILSDRLV